MISLRGREICRLASQARHQGRLAAARQLIEGLIAQEPDAAPAWNMLGLVQLDEGDPAACRSLEKAAQLDPNPAEIWYNLSRAFAAVGQHESELACLDQALARQAYFLPALLSKGKSLTRLGREGEAIQLMRAFLAGIPDDSAFPPAIRTQLAEARAAVAADAERRADRFSSAMEEIAALHPGADLRRARGYAEHRAGRRKIYHQQPTGGHFPFLPALEFFDRALFPWFEALEAETGAIRSELLSFWAEDDPSFRPYVAFDAATPVNQWAELNHSPRWSAWFLWEDGVRNDAHCARCPATAAALAKVPLLDIPGKAPSVMFSVLQPGTRIPPHTGTSNARTTVHLPLVVPEGCGFRVGAETRTWREGEAWAFDDTIEHEAWNDSPHPRAILILDVWNPLLSEAERAAVRLVG
ncbi:MAG TPA: aspartyl/asparaginyl beta-hydroxylase domain-containing protein [Allosphingosinicella sp.]|jgi:aspartyl/asparaginyl beta-hydroxylase (cupin superfamily)/Tfp pilus assembly protein PilF